VIKILFFASLREKVGCDSLVIDPQSEITIEELKSQLKAKGEPWKSALSGSVLAAIDQEMVTSDAIVPDPSEVAFFPPVTGG
jgi:molybdopterin synthase sulfur carrier subunit